MKTKIIYRKPQDKQSVFLISSTHKKVKNIRRGLELMKDLHVNVVNFENQGEKDNYDCAIACEEVALNGVIGDVTLCNKFRHAVSSQSFSELKNIHRVSLEGGQLLPEKLRMKVYQALLNGATGIEYDSLYDGAITKDSKKGPLFDYIEDMNYRVREIGRTLLSLKKVDMSNLSFSAILSEQELPEKCGIGEFEDREGNRYLFIQNQAYEEKEKRLFSLKLKGKKRVYRVNPHDGKQLITKEAVDVFKVLIMPGDADLLRFQDAEAEACLVEYVMKM